MKKNELGTRVQYEKSAVRRPTVVMDVSAARVQGDRDKAGGVFREEGTYRR